MKTKLQKDGSIIIPQELLEKLKLAPGSELELELHAEGELRLAVLTNSTKLPDPATLLLQNSIARKNLTTQMQFIKGVGEKLAELLEKRGVKSVEDALYLLPHRYEDRRELSKILHLRPGFCEVFYGRIVSAETVVTKSGRRFFEVIVADDSGSISFKWFNPNATWMRRTWQVGKEGVFTGEVSQFGYQREIHHPDVEWLKAGQSVSDLLAADPVNFGRIVPVYPLTEGVSQKVMRRVMKNVVDTFLPSLQELIPKRFLKPMKLPPLRDSLHALHLPGNNFKPDDLNQGKTVEHRAVAYDEFFFWELGLALKKRGVKLEEGIAFQVTHRYTKQLVKMLPFDLTAAQRKVLSEIKTDMMAPHPMHRLVQGDVGSGKTIVALMAALIAVENGYQVAMMAPTEILAEQHWHTIHSFCLMMEIETLLVTARMKGSAKKEALAKIADGRAKIVIGTHAVIQEKVEFARLGLGIIDEQHRFGVLQRGILRKKGENPDILVMTATPIPRTLSMTLFGDLSLSVIDELPSGRIPVDTSIAFESRRSQVYEIVRNEIKQKRQAYIIYPLVEETEKSDLKAATQMAEHLESQIFPDFRVGLLHGRMNPEEKEKIMASFKSRELDILVSTTVIEVGIDVPNATLMIIEHAERFGLSQLHQLRGRVGRGDAKSHCILLTTGKLSEDGEKRLRVIESTNDGFRIAEADLEIRGPGDFLGIRQAGMPDFRVANILRDGSILEQARAAAFAIVEEDGDMEKPENALLREEMLHRWGQRLELATIG